jgi:hypothetical protein
MAIKLISADALPELGEGYARKAVDRELDRIAADLDDRPDDPKARTLTIKLAFKPKGNGVYEVALDAKATLPAYRPPTTNAKMVVGGGGLAFSTDSAANPQQQAIPGMSRDDADDQ